jgi:hypothetical protein
MAGILKMASISDFPQLKGLLDPKGTTTKIETKDEGGVTYVRVTEHFEVGEGSQTLFKIVGNGAEPIARDNVVEFPSPPLTTQAAPHYNGTMSDADHAKVAAEAVKQVDVYKTGDGPDHGNRACMWACRHVVYFATNVWITKSDGTATFYDELTKGGMKPDAADKLPPGAIIISPTTSKGVGHVGILGAGHGNGRLVYSNHSPSKKDPVARWKQNYTVKSFTEVHKDEGLATYFYRLPMVGAAVS